MSIGFELRSDRRSGDNALTAKLHQEGYRHLGPRFGAPFDDYVQQTLDEAKLDERQNRAGDRTRIWFADYNGMTIGCSALVDRGERAQLRWLVVLDEARGLGAGRALLEAVLKHAKHAGFREIFLETIDELTPSMTLYERSGFQLVSKKNTALWYGENGCEVVMSLKL